MRWAATIACWVLTVGVLGACGFVAWATSTEERFIRAIGWIQRYRDWRNNR